ncbi:MAG: phosphatidylinositol-specific phospholipase C/glycerophosphodiester phosphodiesterase family protein [Pirellulales bacterium]
MQIFPLPLLKLGTIVLSCLASIADAQTVNPLPNAHAHNDYEHDRPLLDALEQGFTSIEADVYLTDGELLVAHFQKDVKADRTLEKLYLKPLYERFQKAAKSDAKDQHPITLLVDIKNQGAATYQVLNAQLQRYAEMLSCERDGKFTLGAVTVIISGDRPMAEIRASNPRFVGIDGRLTDLESSDSASLLPLISDNWRNHFKYRGEGQMNDQERSKLTQIVKSAHDKGRRVRFWATPETEDMWSELVRTKVDLIGTDNLIQLSNFMREQK